STTQALCAPRFKAEPLARPSALDPPRSGGQFSLCLGETVAARSVGVRAVVCTRRPPRINWIAPRRPRSSRAGWFDRRPISPHTPRMANSFGHLFRITTWGESHGGGVGVVVDGCPPRLELTEAAIQPDLDRGPPGQAQLVTP